MASTNIPTGDVLQDTVNVVCRFRPQLQVEVIKGGTNCAYLNAGLVSVQLAVHVASTAADGGAPLCFVVCRPFRRL